MDGWITIGTEINNNKFDKQILDLEKKMKKEEDKKIIIETKLSNQEQELEKAREKTDALAEAYERLKNVQDKLASGKASPGDFSTFQELEKSYGSLEKLGNSFDKALSKQDAIELKVTQTKNKYDELTSKVDEYKNKIEGIKLQKQVAEVEKVKNSFKGLGNSLKASAGDGAKNIESSLQRAVKEAKKLVLAIFGIRSAYMAMRQASSYLSTYDKQYATNLEYIKYSLTQVIAPVLRYIVSLAGTVLGYISAILKSLFGINIFSNSSAKSFQKMKTGASGASKAVKEIKKQLAGFDEMNVLSNNDNDDSGGSGGGAISPNFDLSEFNPTSSLMDAIMNGDWYGVGVLLGEKLNEAMENIPWDKIQNTARTIGRDIAEFLNGFIATTDWYQVGNTFAQGLNTVIYFGYEFIKTFDWKQFGTAIANAVNGFFDNVDWGALAHTISAGLAGIFNTITGFFQTLDWGIIVDSIITFFQNVDYSGISDAFFEMLGSAAASLVNLGMVIGEYINQAIDSAKEYFQQKIEECGGNVILGILKGILDALIGIGQWIIENIFQPFIDGFKEAFGINSPSTVMVEMGTYIMEGLFNGITSLVDKITEIWNNMKETVITIFNKVKDKLSEIWTNIKTTATTLFTSMKDSITEKFNNIKTNAQQIWNNIKTTITDKVTNLKTNISNMLNNIKTTWSNIWTSMKTTVTNIFGGIWSTIKGVINSILGGIESMANGVVNGVNTVVNRLNSMSFDIPDWVPGYGGKKWGMNIPTMGTVSLPRLKSGGIINMPNRGTLVGNAIAGESGREGVIPLTDGQAMAELGREIGKNVLVNLTNVTTMNGRVISREIKKVGNKQDFAYNT